VRLRETSADGFIPASTLGGGEFWRHDETAHALVGDRTGHTYRLGDDVDVRLVEAIPTAGALRFEMLSEAQRGQAMARMGRGPKRLRQRNRQRY
jgi:ribonuclease R